MLSLRGSLCTNAEMTRGMPDHRRDRLFREAGRLQFARSYARGSGGFVEIANTTLSLQARACLS